MADLTVASWTVTVEKKTIRGKQKDHRVKLVVGDGTDTYPTGGIPMPVAGTLGFVRFIDHVQIIDASDADGLMYKIDQANNKLRIWNPTNQTGSTGFRAGNELVGTTDAVGTATIYVNAVGW